MKRKKRVRNGESGLRETEQEWRARKKGEGEQVWKKR